MDAENAESAENTDDADRTCERQTRWVSRLARLAAFGLPLLVYLLTLAPGITWAHHGADGGDLITAAYTLGIPHPPGYPTYVLLGWLFGHLPLANVAWRFNLMSAVGAALAALGVHCTVEQSLRSTPPRQRALAGLAAAWTLSFAPLLWQQAVIAEVYAPGLAFAAWTVYLAVRTRSDRRPAVPLLLGLVWGLGVGVHPTHLALAPLVLWGLWPRPGTRVWCLTPAFLAGLLSGLSTFVLLPLRAGRGALTWGDPTSLSGFWWLISGALYRDYVFALPLAGLGARLSAWVIHLYQGLTLPGLVVAGAGAAVAARRAPAGLLAGGLSWLAYTIYALGYDTIDSYVYLLPTLALAAVALGYGWGALLGSAPSRRSHWHLNSAAAAALALLVPLAALALNWRSADPRVDCRATDFSSLLLGKAPANTVLLSSADAHTFTLWYNRHVEGQRPDLDVVDTGLLAFDWYRQQLARQSPGLNVVETLKPDGWQDANPGRPVCSIVSNPAFEEDIWLRCIEPRP